MGQNLSSHDTLFLLLYISFHPFNSFLCSFCMFPLHPFHFNICSVFLPLSMAENFLQQRIGISHHAHILTSGDAKNIIYVPHGQHLKNIIYHKVNIYQAKYISGNIRSRKVWMLFWKKKRDANILPHGRETYIC